MPIGFASPDLATVDGLFSRARRRFVRLLAYTVVLPLCSCSRSDADEAFSRAIAALFAVLAAWDHTDAAQTIRLDISAACSDASHTHAVDAAQPAPVLRLLPSTVLKSVPRITFVDFARRQWYRIDGAAACRICASLPDLLDATLLINDDAALPPAVRRQTRHGIARVLDTLPPSLSSLYIDAPDCTPLNEAFSPPRLDAHQDSLSLALHRLTLFASLTTVRIVGGLPVAPELFWPPHYDEPGTALPTWPSLQKLTISFSLVAPSGKWYVAGPSSNNAPASSDESASADDEPDDSDDGDDDDDDNATRTSLVASGMHPTQSFRSDAVPALVNPLFLAIARAASRMPRLKYLEASARLRAAKGNDNPALATVFATPGTRHYLDKRHGGLQANLAKTRVYVSAPGMDGLLDSRVVWAWEKGFGVGVARLVF
ncbi:hypothetical protein SLS55_006805 [Diplodia seriata]|uniref:Uncharacterized protein n=1 Tax=Diplodia seriata TaxID=420778 RepID=A0ABR3CAI1_9PEZI